MTFTGYQLCETPQARLLLGLSARDSFWVNKNALTNAALEPNPFGRRQRITCEIADWWWVREEQRRAVKGLPAAGPKRKTKAKLHQAQLL